MYCKELKDLGDAMFCGRKCAEVVKNLFTRSLEMQHSHNAQTQWRLSDSLPSYIKATQLVLSIQNIWIHSN